MLAKIGSVGCLDFEKMGGGSSRTSGDVEGLASSSYDGRKKLWNFAKENWKKRGSGK